jgi:hypothetical protein
MAKKTVAPVVATPNAANLLMQMAAGGKKKTTAAKKPDRPILELTPTAEENFRAWVPAKILADHFDEHLKNVVTQLDEELIPLYVKSMWEAKSQPQNPKLVAKKDGLPDLEGMLVVQERFSIASPDVTDGSDPAEAMVAILVGVGLLEVNAKKLVENEFDFMPQVDIHLTELLHGKKDGKSWREPSTVEKTAATKVINFISGVKTDSLTDEERAVLTVTTMTKVTCKSGGFLERAAGYCTTFEQLKNLITIVMHPVMSHRGAKFGISESLDERNSRLISEAAGILGVALGANDASSNDNE